MYQQYASWYTVMRQIISQCNLYFESSNLLKDFLPACLSQEQIAHAHKLHASKNQGRKEISEQKHVD